MSKKSHEEQLIASLGYPEHRTETYKKYLSNTAKEVALNFGGRAMAVGMALTIGLNSVNPDNYDGWTGDLAACEFDANDMAAIANSKGFQVKTLLTKDATRENVTNEISKAAATLKAGDIFMLSYSGHGGQVPDINNDEEFDAKDETWCLYNGQLIDDELNVLFSKFNEGARILVFSDSCHSGTVTKEAFTASIGAVMPGYRQKWMKNEIATKVYLKNQAFYDKILNSIPKDAEDSVKASALLISACQDGQTSLDGDKNGLFTSLLLRVWNAGKFKGSYRTFRNRIYNLSPGTQKPNYYRTGKINPSFEKQKPFTI